MRPKILIVDDLLENLIGLEAILEDFDCDLIRAFSGEEALKHSLKDDFALVILDVQMPGMNGYETLEMMRQRKKTKYLPVIFVSAIHQSDLYIIKGISSGAVDFIPKPIIPDILKGKVQVFLDLYLQRKKMDILLAEMEETNLNLKIAKAKAENATRTKSMFLANMTHEIRTPLNGVIGLSKLLQKTPLNNDQQELVNIIITSGENLFQIVNDILDFSKIESGQIQLENIDFDINSLLKNVYQLMKFRADEKGVSFKYSIAPEIPLMLNGDPLRISQIVMNLVNNAIKFTHQGFVEIHVELVDKIGDSVRILFRINDSGIGITDEGMLMLFKEFSQSDSSTSRKYGGTGLGLAISKNLVSLMGGEIGVKSQIHEGSEFWFRLQLREAKNEVTDANSKPEPIPKKLKILLAEDNIINQLVAKLTLKQYGLDCDVSNNGQEAYELYLKSNYDLVLMDMQMPEVDGLQATAMIRAFEKENTKRNQVYIVALTANAMAEDKQRCLLAGMNNFMSKPFTEKELSLILIEAGRHNTKQK